VELKSIWSGPLQHVAGTCILGLPFLRSGVFDNGLLMLYIIDCSGSRGTPAMSILSKCVPSSQLGKIFSLFGAFQILLGMVMSYFNTMVN
jgi:hypothetical protein